MLVRDEGAQRPAAGADLRAGRKAAPVHYFERDCKIRWGGALHPHALRYAEGVGPLSVLGAQGVWRGQKAHFGRVGRRDGMSEYTPARLLVRLTGRKPATIAISPSHRAHASMIFDAATSRPAYAVSEGHAAIQFLPCDDAAAVIYDGVFVVAGAQCLPVEFWVSGRDEPVVRRIPFGRRAC